MWSYTAELLRCCRWFVAWPCEIEKRIKAIGKIRRPKNANALQRVLGMMTSPREYSWFRQSPRTSVMPVFSKRRHKCGTSACLSCLLQSEIYCGYCTLHLANTLINNISILSFLCDGDSHGVMWLRLQVKRLQQNVKSSTQEKRWTSQTGRDVHVCNHVQPFSRSPTCVRTDRQKYTMPLHIPRWQIASCDKNCKCEHYVL